MCVNWIVIGSKRTHEARRAVEQQSIVNIARLIWQFNRVDMAPRALRPVNWFANGSKHTHKAREQLHRNQLSTLPKTLGNLTALRTLSLSFNQLSTLPDTFGKLITLERLYMSNNKFRRIPPSLGYHTTLALINLEDNLTLADVLFQQFHDCKRNTASRNQWRQNVVNAYRTALLLWRTQKKNNTHSLDAAGTMVEVMDRLY